PGNGYMEEDEVIIPCSEDLNFILFTDGITEAIHKKTEELLGRENLKKYTSDFFITKKKENFLEGLLQKIEEENFDTHQDDCSILLVHSINSKNLILSDKIELSFDLIQDMGNRILKSLQKEGWEDKTTFMIELLSIEYLNNIIQHNEKKEIKVHVSLQNYNDFCLLIFVDNAPSWNFNAFYSKSDDDDDSLRSRGRGLSIIKRILSNVEFSRNAGENNCIFKIARNAAEKLREEG
ncbi:MAG: ATP-binding protein, partial [Verrucomicrobiota bacterium]|nr:ATP-binding protein [Verrucomicrobiota bacterium]